MKATPWLLPVATALAVGGWIASRKHAAATLERELTVLRERVHLAKADAEADRNAADGKTPGSGKRSVNWKEMAVSFGTGDGDGPEEIRMMVRTQRWLYGLSAEELCGELDKLSSAELDPRARRRFEGMIIDILVEKSPKLALERAGDQLTDEDHSRQMASALGKWAQSDPIAAAAWLDKQIAAGVLAGKSLDGDSRIYPQYESGLIGVLFQSDLKSAAKRLASMPEEQRLAVFYGRWSKAVDPAKEGDFVALVREAGGDSNVERILSQYAANLVHGQDFERVDRFISVSRATPDEKAAIVSTVMEQSFLGRNSGVFNPESFDKVRAWAAANAPESVDENTGKMLAGALWTQKNRLEDVTARVLKYNEASGNDETLIAFLTSEPVRRRGGDDKARILELAAKIKDPAKQQEVLDRIQGKQGKP